MPRSHQFRHTFAHRWLHSGGTEGDLMSVAGWRRATCSPATARLWPPNVPVTRTDGSPRRPALMVRKKSPLPESTLTALFCPSCNDEVGLVFADERDDEVVLIFMQGDDRRPMRTSNSLWVRAR